MSRLPFITIIILLLTSCGNKLPEAEKEHTYSEIKPTEEWLNSLNDDSTIMESSSKYKNLKKSTEFNYTILYRASDLMNEDSQRKKVNIKTEKDSIIINYYMNIRGYYTIIPYCEMSDSVFDIKYWKPSDVMIQCFDGKCDTNFVGIAISNILQLEIVIAKKLLGKRKIKIQGKELDNYAQYNDYAMRPTKALKIAQEYVAKKYSDSQYYILPKEIYSIDDSCYHFETSLVNHWIKVNALTGNVSQEKKN